MMETPQLYDPSEHQAFLEAWCQQWGVTLSIGALPKVGLIVPGIAAAFLFQTDSEVCFIDAVITNRDAPDTLRDECLDLIVDGIVSLATAKGFKTLQGVSKVPAISERARRLGFRIAKGKYHVMNKDL